MRNTWLIAAAVLALGACRAERDERALGAERDRPGQPANPPAANPPGRGAEQPGAGMPQEGSQQGATPRSGMQGQSGYGEGSPDQVRHGDAGTKDAGHP